MNLLAFSYSAKPKWGNQESRRKEIQSCNNVYVYVFIAATILNWQTEHTQKLNGCQPPKKVYKALVGAAKYQSRFKKWEKLYPISSSPNSPE